MGKICAGLKFLLWVPFFFLLIIQAAGSAEIININYKYKFAFSDLNENDVHVGNLVEVVLPDGKKAYLKVFETYPVMAKLIVADQPEFTLNERDFASIKIGSRVAVVSSKILPVRNPTIPVSDSPSNTVPVEKPAMVEESLPGEVFYPKQALISRNNSAAEPKGSVSGIATKNVSEAKSPILSVHNPGDASRVAELEKRLDQMMLNNVKFAESITQLLSEKNESELKLKQSAADLDEARKKLDGASAANRTLESNVKSLGTEIEALRQAKALADQEVSNLRLKLGELRKRIARIIEIVNNNMKAHENP